MFSTVHAKQVPFDCVRKYFLQPSQMTAVFKTGVGQVVICGWMDSVFPVMGNYFSIYWIFYANFDAAAAATKSCCDKEEAKERLQHWRIPSLEVFPTCPHSCLYIFTFLILPLPFMVNPPEKRWLQGWYKTCIISYENSLCWSVFIRKFKAPLTLHTSSAKALLHVWSGAYQLARAHLRQNKIYICWTWENWRFMGKVWLMSRKKSGVINNNPTSL